MRKFIAFLGIVLLLMCGCSVQKVKEQSEQEKFAIEYNISKDNPFHYANIEEVLQILQQGDAILYLGDSDCEWAQMSIQIFHKVCQEQQIEKVWYFNMKQAKSEHPKQYKQLIAAPAFFFIQNGNILSYSLDYELLSKKNIDGYTKKEAKELKNKYRKMMKQYLSAVEVGDAVS